MQELPKYPEAPGVYMLKDSLGKILYVGRAKKLSARVSQLTALQPIKSNNCGYTHVKARRLRQYQNTKKVYVEFIITKDVKEAIKREKEIIKSNNPPWNNIQC
jgi:excinuclease UvrABC nuclease subunit